MNLDFDHDLYNQSHVPSDFVIRFLAETLPCLGWGQSRNEVVMDVGCGDGGITTDLILPLFPRLEKMVAFDVLPKMIDVASKRNSHPGVEYAVADIEDWSSVQQWKGQITHLLSVHCFHWLRDQQKAFRNSHRLLKSSGEAAFIFFLEASFFTACLQIQKNPKWCHFFNEIGSYIPESHHKKHSVFFYRKMLEDVGFDIIHCIERKIKDVLPSDEDYINFFTSVCVLVNHVPVERKEEFRTDLFQEILKHNGRDGNGLPFHTGTIIELVVRKS